MNEFVEVEDLGEAAPFAILPNTTSSGKDKIYKKYKYIKYIKSFSTQPPLKKGQNMDKNSIYKTCHLGELKS